MEKYIFGKVVVRIHGEVDRERIEKACKTYLSSPPSKTKKENQK